MIKTVVTMTGASATLLAAKVSRNVVIVSNAEANAAAAIDPSGGTCALNEGLALPAGTHIKLEGSIAQSAITQIGTNTQKLTVFTDI